MKCQKSFGLSCLLIWPLALGAEVYRCESNSGVSYSDRRCGSGYIEIIKARPEERNTPVEQDSAVSSPTDSSERSLMPEVSEMSPKDAQQCQVFRMRLLQYESQNVSGSEELKKRTEEQIDFYRKKVEEFCR
jgi:hypothetical protein